MKYTLHYTGGRVSADTRQEFIDLLSARGIEFNGVHARRYTRSELQGQPKFKGICGPMWNGEEGIRYECPHTYAEMCV
jgi:hypothetical protein